MKDAIDVGNLDIQTEIVFFNEQRRCYNCNKKGHIKRYCKEENYEFNDKGNTMCQVCHKRGHTTINCWYKDEEIKRNKETGKSNQKYKYDEENTKNYQMLIQMMNMMMKLCQH